MYILTLVSLLNIAPVTLTTTFSPMSLEDCLTLQEVLVNQTQTAEYKKDAKLLYSKCVPEAI